MAKKFEWPLKEKQGELFSDFPPAGGAEGGRLAEKSVLHGRKIGIQLSYENTALLFIALIMLLVIFFALGVERGKRAIPVAARNEKIGSSLQLPLPIVETGKLDAAPPDILPSAGPAKEVSQGEKAISAPGLAPYTIQVIAFKEEKIAGSERERLKREGYEAFIISSNGWSQVCAGRYASREESKKDLEALKSRYPTLYLRRVDK